MVDFHAKRAPHHYLLIPVMPTPNGRLHLGHIAGPFLKMDILARHLRRGGDKAWLISGTDPHDSFVLLKAHQTKQTPEQVANHFHALILNDLRSLDILPDAFINPLQPEWSALYTLFSIDTVNSLINKGVTEIRRERFLYCPASDRYIVGCWLLGRCPACGSDAGSYFCEECGMHFRPEMFENPHSRLDEGALEWREVRCLYLRLSATTPLFSRMAAMGLPDAFQHTVRQHIASQGALIRLTQPSTWGVPWSVPGEPVPQVLFTYAVAIIALWLVCGEAYGDLVGTGVNAFSPSSDVTTIASFGIDNALPFLLSGLGANLELGTFKPLDHFLLNYFYYLEGAKFSTSRGHVIWAGDIAEGTAVGSDAVRGYLARVNPEREVANFDLQDFLGFVNHTLAARFQDAVSTLWPQMHANGYRTPPGQLMRHLGQLLDQQKQAFDPLRFHLSAALDVLDTWFDTRPVSGGAATYWWLKGLALLAYPFLPKFGTAVWQALGHKGLPTILEFKEPLMPHSSCADIAFQHIEAADLNACLPPTLQPAVPKRLSAKG